MALGVKVKYIKTQKTYTLDSFFEAIKDKTFTAGTPSMTKHGPAYLITFPALDSQNQVQIINGSFSKESQKWSVQKAQEAGVTNVVANMAIDKLTGGLFGLKSMIGSTAKRCEELVDITVKELGELNL